MDHTGDINGIILRVITAAGTTISTASTAIGLASNNCWRPQKLYITVGTTERFLPRMLFLPLQYMLDRLVISVHRLISTVEFSPLQVKDTI